eukprot:541679-Prymnesium_polylepis.1
MLRETVDCEYVRETDTVRGTTATHMRGLRFVRRLRPRGVVHRKAPRVYPAFSHGARPRPASSRAARRRSHTIASASPVTMASEMAAARWP